MIPVAIMTGIGAKSKPLGLFPGLNDRGVSGFIATVLPSDLLEIAHPWHSCLWLQLPIVLDALAHGIALSTVIHGALKVPIRLHLVGGMPIGLKNSLEQCEKIVNLWSRGWRYFQMTNGREWRHLREIEIIFIH
jgi:hypothetical protein